VKASVYILLGRIFTTLHHATRWRF